MPEIPVVYKWREDDIQGLHCKSDWSEKIDCNNIAHVIDWINKFTNHHRLSNDVGLPLERAVIGAYQIGYIYDYERVKEKDRINFETHMEEGLASILLHSIASYEMLGRQTINLRCFFIFKKWNDLCYGTEFLKETNLSENMFKYLRWILYNHMGRTKRWNEDSFSDSINNIIEACCRKIKENKLSLSTGFAYCMSKLQDADIKRH